MIKTLKKGLSFLAFLICTYAVNAHTTSNNFTKDALTHAGVTPTSDVFLLEVNYSFTSSVNNNKVLLNWSTSSEKNASNYVVQRSSNNADWENIGVVTAAGNCNINTYYSFIDEEPVNGINYYRLAQNDLDGNQNHSKTITTNFRNSNNLLNVFPNPVLNGSLNISLNKNATIYLYSNSGSKLMEKTLSAGQHYIDVSKFAKGNYFIKMDKETEVFIIQ